MILESYDEIVKVWTDRHTPTHTHTRTHTQTHTHTHTHTHARTHMHACTQQKDRQKDILNYHERRKFKVKIESTKQHSQIN